MLILLFCIFVVLTTLVLNSRDYDWLSMITVPILFIILVAIIIIGIIASGLKVIDEKIEMYETENARIESQIGDVVTQYMNYEKDTLTELKVDSSMVLVSLYPELKSDELIMAQITTYQANNEKIKNLKESKINESVYKWWLYFGD